MYVTVTANPSVDRTIEVRGLVRGGLHRATAVHVQPGGKGINVARALVSNGIKARAVVPAGGAEGEQLISLLSDYSIDVVRVPALGPVRMNVSVIEPDATVTKLNEPGARLTATETAALADAVVNAAHDASWVVVAGSLPPGVEPRFYADLILRLARADVRVAVDTSGLALRAALTAGPTLVKPNHHELAEAVDRPLSTLGDVVDAATHLRSLGAGAVLASLGSDGAVLVDDDGVWHAEAPVVSARSSVGAGDAMLAGFLAGGGTGAQALVSGVAWGAAAVSLPGSTMPRPEHLRGELVVVRAGIEAKRRLSEDH
ncbi:1-phosphofructokinase [Actinocrispum wychmicini]|uniref:1-phosphofructokinase n=1 Tax=Actinocrispum wychmicini TaxID=1213861 RepID=A0A4V2S698_9PSEU|nr:1-phosphofructokinase [Actinocrispum wychmicini]TCO55230.1 1-phosphofructokinase [Actinocrispum wychmicini]